MIGIKLLYSPTLPISPSLIMTGSTFLDQDIDLDCNCGMGAKCLLVRRKHEKAKIIQRQEQHSQHSSSRSVYHFNKELTKMSKWNNIADLTQHRETIKVRNLKNYIRERFELFLMKGELPWSGKELQCGDLQHPGWLSHGASLVSGKTFYFGGFTQPVTVEFT